MNSTDAMDLCSKLRDLEDFFYGCRNECDQKCVIDNHEVQSLVESQLSSMLRGNFEHCEHPQMLMVL